MAELQLTRSTGDRQLYVLQDIGTLRLAGWGSRRGSAEAGGCEWAFSHRGFWRRGIDAVDAAGGSAGGFEPRAWHRGGTLSWEGRDLALSPASVFRERYALADGERELALLDGHSWGRRPVRITLDDGAALDAGLLLFAAFVVRSLAAERAASSSGAAGGAAAAVSG
jgi:hypothetical protein